MALLTYHNAITTFLGILCVMAFPADHYLSLRVGSSAVMAADLPTHNRLLMLQPRMQEDIPTEVHKLHA